MVKITMAMLFAFEYDKDNLCSNQREACSMDYLNRQDICFNSSSQMRYTQHRGRPSENFERNCSSDLCNANTSISIEICFSN